MNIIRSSHDIRLMAPSSVDTEAWLRSMSDSGWRVLTDFRNWPDWVPVIHSVKQADSEPPARGTKLEVVRTHRVEPGCIERWDPPQGLEIIIDYGSGEMAFGFLIEILPKSAEIRFSLELERGLTGISRTATFLLKWRLQALGEQMIDSWAARTRPANNL